MVPNPGREAACTKRLFDEPGRLRRRPRSQEGVKGCWIETVHEDRTIENLVGLSFPKVGDQPMVLEQPKLFTDLREHVRGYAMSLLPLFFGKR